MRTTIIFDDHLGQRLREEARRRKQSFSAFLAEAGRRALDESRETRKDASFELITFGSAGIQAGIDLERTNSLLTAEDEESYRS